MTHHLDAFIVVPGKARVQATDANLQATQGFLQRLLESPANGHHFTDRLHLRGEPTVGLRKLFKGKTRDLGHHIVNRGLKGGRGGATGDFVRELIQGVADSQLRCDLGDREAGGF